MGLVRWWQEAGLISFGGDGVGGGGTSSVVAGGEIFCLLSGECLLLAHLSRIKYLHNYKS